MSMPEALKRISDTIWELPVSYKQGMKGARTHLRH